MNISMMLLLTIHLVLFLMVPTTTTTTALDTGKAPTTAAMSSSLPSSSSLYHSAPPNHNSKYDVSAISDKLALGDIRDNDFSIIRKSSSTTNSSSSSKPSVNNIDNNATSNSNNVIDNNNKSIALCINCHALFEIQVIIHNMFKTTTTNDDGGGDLPNNAHRNDPQQKKYNEHYHPEASEEASEWMVNRQWFLSLHELRHDTNEEVGEEESNILHPLVDLLPLDNNDGTSGAVSDCSMQSTRRNDRSRSRSTGRRNDDAEEGQRDGSTVVKCFMAKVPVPYFILAARPPRGGGKEANANGDTDDDYYSSQSDGRYHNLQSHQRTMMRRREIIVMASLWREEQVVSPPLLGGGDDTNTTMDNFHSGQRILVDRQLVHVVLPTPIMRPAVGARRTGDYRSSSFHDDGVGSGTRTRSRRRRGRTMQFHYDPVYSVVLEDTVQLFHPEQHPSTQEDKKNEEEMPTNNNEWYRIAFASFVGLFGGMVGLFAISHTLPTGHDEEEMEVAEGEFLTPSSPRSNILAEDYEMPLYSPSEHGMKGVRLFHNEDDSSSSGRHSSSPSSTSPLVQNDGFHDAADQHSEYNDTNDTVSPTRSTEVVDQRIRMIDRRSLPFTNTTTTGSLSSMQSMISTRQLDIEDEIDMMHITNVVKSTSTVALSTLVINSANKLVSSSNASAEEKFDLSDGSQDECQCHREVTETNHDIDNNMTSSPQQSPLIAHGCASHPDHDPVCDMDRGAVTGSDNDVAFLAGIESTLKDMDLVDEVQTSDDAVESHSTQTCSEKQAGKKIDSPPSPPKIVRIVLKKQTPNSPCFNPVVVATIAPAPSTSDDQPNITSPAQDCQMHLSPKGGVLAPSVSSSVATAWTNNRSIDFKPRRSTTPYERVCNSVSSNCEKRQRRQSSKDARAPGLTNSIHGTNRRQPTPEAAVHPHASNRTEKEIHPNPASPVGQHDDASQASFGVDNDTLLSPMSSEHTNGQEQRFRFIHLNNSSSPTSTVAATVHEYTAPRRKLCNDFGDHPLPIPSGGVGQRKRFGLASTHVGITSSSLGIPDLTERAEESKSSQIDSPMKNPRSKRKIRKIEKRLLATTRKPVVHVPSSTLISLSERMEEPPSWQFSSERSY